MESGANSQSSRKVRRRYRIGMKIEYKIISAHRRLGSFNPCGICPKGLNTPGDSPPFTAPGA